MSVSRKLYGAALVLTSSSLSISAAMAETAEQTSPDSSALEDGSSTSENLIVVTARRSSEDLNDVPIVINTFDSEQLEKLNISSVEDLSNFTPGLEFTAGNRPGFTQVSLRGLAAEVGRSSTAIRVDDVDVTAEAIYSFGLAYFPNQRLLDLQRVEVVKGAQVALYGRSAFGGAINFVTRRPDLDAWSGSVGGRFTSENEWEVIAKVRGPISEGKVGLGLTAAYWDDGGSYRNQVSGDRLGTQSGHGISASLLMEPTSNVSNYLRIEYSEEDSSMAPAEFFPANTAFTFAPDVGAVLNSGTTRAFVGEVPNPGSDQVFIGLDPFTGNDFDAVDKRDFVFSNNLEVELDGVSLRSLTGYIDLAVENFQPTVYQPQPWINPDGTINAAGTGAIAPGFVSQLIYIDTKQDIFSQELQLFSNDDTARFRWLIGGLFWRENIEQGQDQPTVIPLGEIATEDVLGFFRDELFDRTRGFTRRTEHLSAFAWAEFDVTDTLAFSLEGRFSSEDIVYRTTNTVNVSLGFPGDPPTFQSVSVIPDPQETGIINDSFFTPKGVLTFKPNEDLTIYGSVAKSVKPAGHSSGAADTFNEFTRFEAENLWSYEFGVKSKLFDNKLNVNTALFYQDYSNQQVRTQILDENSNVPRSATQNAGDSRIWGVDFDFIARLAPELTVSGAYTYINAKFTDYEFYTTSATQAVNGPCVRFETIGNRTGCIISYDGNRIGQIPKHQFSLLANYTTPVSDTFDFFVEPNARYKSKRFLNNGNLATAPAFWRFDLRAGVTSDNFQITAFVENLFDDKSPTNVLSQIDFAGGFTPGALAFLPDPLTVGINAKYTF